MAQIHMANQAESLGRRVVEMTLTQDWCEICPCPARDASGVSGLTDCDPLNFVCLQRKMDATEMRAQIAEAEIRRLREEAEKALQVQMQAVSNPSMLQVRPYPLVVLN